MSLNLRKSAKLGFLRCCRYVVWFLCVILPICLTASVVAQTELQITDKTDPKIVELYNQLQKNSEQIFQLNSQRTDELNKNLDTMREHEQSGANRALTAASTGITGVGGMLTASAISEQKADKEAEEDMRGYLETFQCEYGKGTIVKPSEGEVTLPGGNELMEYYNEYKQLADRLKTTKTALGLRKGIESETLYDKAQTELYQYANVGKTGSTYTSLSRALTDPESADAAAWAEQKKDTKNKLTAGIVTAGVGVVVGAVGNYEINKDAPKEMSKEINEKYDAQVTTLTQEKETIESALYDAIEQNAKAVRAHNKGVAQCRLEVQEIEKSHPDCRELFGKYVTAVAGLELIENETDFVPDITFPEMDSDLLAKCVECKNKDAVFYAETKTCECPEDRPIEKDGKCVEKPVEVTPVVETPVNDEKETGDIEEKDEKEETPAVSDDPNICAVGKKHTAGFGIVAGETRVGDRCTSALVLDGEVFKRKNGTCGCSARICETRNGRAAIAEGGVCVCDKEKGYKDENGKCVKQQSSGAYSGAKKTNEFVDENGFCKPYKIKEWFFNKEQTADISKKFQKLCDDAAKVHNCKRKDLNTSRLIEKDDSGAVQYEWTCNADSEDYLATQERINQRHANLSYENVCKKLKPGTTNQEGQIKRGCFRLFEDIDIPDYKTQLELAKARIGTSSACSEKREVRRSTASNNPVGYYTNCNTTNDKERYTFIFTGVGNGNTTPENLMRAACATYGVKFGAQGGELGSKQPYCSYKYTGEKDPTCVKIDALAQKFGYNARIVRGTGCVLDTTGTVGGDQLTKSGMRSDEKIRNLRTAFDIDNTLFANISTNMDEWLYDQIRTIVENEMKRAGHSDPLVKFECFPEKSFALDKGIEKKLFGNVSGRNVLTCQANGRNIDFVFEGLGHVTKRRAKATQEGLTCIFGANGKYDGRKCWGLTEEKCIDLNNTIKAHATNCPACGANWVNPPGMCALTKSTKVEKTNVGLEIAGNAAVMAGAAVLTIFTEGATVTFLVTTAVETTGLVAEAWTSHGIRNKADRFLAKTSTCNNATCAEELLDEEEVRNILQLENDLSEKQVNIIDDELARLLNLMPENSPLSVALAHQLADKPNCNFWNKLNPVARCDWRQVLNGLAQVAQFASLGYGLGRAGIKLAKTHTKMTQMASKTATKMTRPQAKKIVDIDANIARDKKKLAKLKNQSSSEAKKLRRQIQGYEDERRHILNELGTKDADEVAKLSAAAYNPEIEKAQSEYQKLLKEREGYIRSTNDGKTPSKKVLQSIDERIAAQEKKLKDLGADVEPVEPLWKPQTNTTKPKADVEAKPAETGTAPKAEQPATPTSASSATQADKTVNKMDDAEVLKLDDVDDVEVLILDDVDDVKVLELDDVDDMEVLILNDADDVAKTSASKTTPKPATPKTEAKVTPVATKNPAPELTDTDKDALFQLELGNSNSSIRKYYPDLSEEQFNKKVEQLRSEINRQKQANGGLTDAQKQTQDMFLDEERAANGGLTNAEKKALEYKKSLNLSTETVHFSKGWVYVSKPGVLSKSGEKLFDTAGLKFHLNVVPNDTDKAASIIRRIVAKYDIPQWKFPEKTADLIGNASEGKQFTLYMGKSIGKNEAQLKQLVRELDQALTSNGIRTGKVGPLLASGDKVADGSKFVHYRYEYAPGATREKFATPASGDIMAPKPKATPVSPVASASRGAATGTTANINTLRNRASSSFDKYLSQVKTNATGKGAKLPKARLTDAEWEAVNKSLAHENVQLVEVVQDGERYMQFRRADAVDDAASAARARASTTTKANDVDEVIELQLDDMFDAHNLRVSDGSGRLYVRNSAQEMLGFPVSGEDAVGEVGQLYNTIRRGIEYPVNDTKVSRAINAMQNPTSTGVVYRAPTDRYPWHVHSYNGARSSAQYHVSLNVKVDDTLIKKLDEIIAKDRGQHIIDFKIPPKGSRWKTMADPISIYMRETSPEIERAIAEAARPYVRTSSEIGLLGRKIDDGVAIAFETSEARMDIVENIINQVARKDINVANALRRKGRYSVGETEALRVWASDFLGYKIKPVVP